MSNEIKHPSRRYSRLPEGGGNLFQRIKEMTLEAEKAGIPILKLSIGEPEGPAFLEARQKAAEIIMSDDEAAHKYNDNSCLFVADFAKRFILCQTPPCITVAATAGEVSFLPLPGMKPVLPMILLACGAGNPSDPDGHFEKIKVCGMTDPGYGVPKTWAGYLSRSVDYSEAVVNPGNNFRFNPSDLPRSTNLVMTNYPNNPSGQVATKEFWHAMCQWAVENDVRLFNDAAYDFLAHSAEHCSLAEIAVLYPGLSWAEAYSASKARNFTGWRVAAIVGSPDFIADIVKIKGNTDSGLCAAQAGGVLHVYETKPELLREVSEMYRGRNALLISILKERGMRLAVQPGAGFFTLWKCPTYAFGERVTNAEHFNKLMIANTGVVGVHFDPNYMRYAVCSDIAPNRAQIEEAFTKAEISYAE